MLLPIQLQTRILNLAVLYCPVMREVDLQLKLIHMLLRPSAPESSPTSNAPIDDHIRDILQSANVTRQTVIDALNNPIFVCHLSNSMDSKIFVVVSRIASVQRQLGQESVDVCSAVNLLWIFDGL